VAPDEFYSRFLRALFQFSKRAAGEATKFRRSGVELVVAAARLECGEPPAEAGELIWRQLGDSLGDFFDFHVMQYSISLEDPNRAGSTYAVVMQEDPIRADARLQTLARSQASETGWRCA